MIETDGGLLQFAGIWDCFRSHERLKAGILILRHELEHSPPKGLRKGCGFPAVIWHCSFGCFSVSPISATPRRSCVLGQSFAGTGYVLRLAALEVSHDPGGRPGIDEKPPISCALCARTSALGRAADYGELLKLGFDIVQWTVSKYMLRRRGPPSQGWRAFLRDHAAGLHPWFPHRSDADIRATVRVRHLGARTPSPSMDQRHE